MATFTSRVIIEKMIANDGTYPGDPQATSIWEYRHAVSDRILWAVFYNEADNDLHVSPYVAESVQLWDQNLGHLNPVGVLEERSR